MHAADDVLGPTRLMAFALEADAEMPAEVTDNRTVPEQPELTADATAIEEGKWKYADNCGGCHGKAAVARFGGSVADLRYANAQTHEQWIAIVIRRRSKKSRYAGLWTPRH